MTEKKLTPQARFERDKCTRVAIKLVNTTDADIIAHLESLPNKQGYIKALIRVDIANDVESVKVVRCRDCKYRGNYNRCPMTHIGATTNDYIGIVDYTIDEGFCNFSEKKDEG